MAQRRDAVRYTFNRPADMPRKTPMTIPNGLELKYESARYPKPPPTIRAATSSTPIRAAIERPFRNASTPIALATVLPLPVCSTFELYQRMAGDARCPVLLESGQGPRGVVPGPRYSIIGADPAFLFRGTGSRVGWCARGEEWIIRAGDPLAALQDLLYRMAVSRPSGFPPFYGGS